MKADAIAVLMRQALGEQVIEAITEQDSPNSITIRMEDFLAVAELLQSHSELYFDVLACITAIDNGPEKNTLELAYNFHSIPYGHQLMLKYTLPRPASSTQIAKAPSVSQLYRTADWHEREAFDLMGIVFEGHPDMRRILLPDDWEGFPLRKDYQQQERYRNVITRY
jgi:NADH-quinone oxidoreductase subunit C